MHSRLALVLALLASSAGCSPPRSATPSEPQPAAPPAGGATAALPGPAPDDPRALAIARDYRSYGRVDDELRWAPFLCRQPMPGVAHSSGSTDGATHGQKLYSVFVKDRPGYPDNVPVGQVVVKESYLPEAVTDPAIRYQPQSLPPGVPEGDHFYPYAMKDGQLYRAGALAGLFIMYQLDPATPGTDRGWVYATVDSAQRVTASGRIEACVTCHENATHGRLFGVPQAY